MRITKSRFCVLIVVCMLMAGVMGSAITIVHIYGSQALGIAGADENKSRAWEINALLQTIRDHEIRDFDEEKMLVGAKKGLVAGVDDPYAYFFTPEEYEAHTTEQSGVYVGIGASFDAALSELVFTKIFKGSPAEKAGLLAGDKVVAVDGQQTEGMTHNEVVDIVRGESGTVVVLVIERNSETIEVPVVRASVDSPRIESNMIDGSLGYIRIYEFTGKASTQFVAAVEELKGQGAQGFIVDLRDNPGGQLDVVAWIADYLLPQGVITTLKDIHGTKQEEYSDAAYLNMPLAVLVNKGSASASELLSIAIQDYEVGTIVGTATYGKGVAQNFIPLSDGSVLKLTTEQYLSPKGRSVDGVGVIPEVVVEESDALKDDHSKFCSPEDNQYAAALEVLREKIGQ